MIIAVDFDGTIVEHRYPQIGKEMPFAIVTLRKLQKEHHLLILWSVHEGVLLRDNQPIGNNRKDLVAEIFEEAMKYITL